MTALCAAFIFLWESILPIKYLPGERVNVVSSWYGEEFHGKLTACGEVYDMNALSCAHRTLPFGTILEVTHDSSVVIVIVNDRGPFRIGVDLDLSMAAFKHVAPLHEGLVQISFRPLGRTIRSTMLYNLGTGGYR
jgi:rare lipoprotein A